MKYNATLNLNPYTGTIRPVLRSLVGTGHPLGRGLRTLIGGMPGLPTKSCTAISTRPGLCRATRNNAAHYWISLSR